QQVARTLLLSRKKTYTRKIKEAILSLRMEEALSKEDILFLYLNQIYLGQGAYGVGSAARIYFRKDLKDITLSEAALLAGMPKAPSRFSPIYNPSRAKQRQKYVLSRMAEENFVAEADAENAGAETLQVYVRKNFKELAPFYIETIRQMLVKHLGEERVLDEGIKVYTGLDLQKQREAQTQVRNGLRDLDKRQGFRGPEKKLTTPEEVAAFLLEERNNLIDETSPVRLLRPDGTFEDKKPLNLSGKDEEGSPLANIRDYLSIDQIVSAVVTQVDDKWGLVYVRFAESKGLIDIETMDWARKPNPEVHYQWSKIKKPSEALAKGDVVQVRITGSKFYSSRINKELMELKKSIARTKKPFERPEELPEFAEYANVELEQEPTAEAALISFDQKTSDVVAMVGGYDFEKSQFNRAIQAARQTGSSFKSLVYAAALDKGFTPSTQILDAPIVFEEEDKSIEVPEGEEAVIKKWKPTNHSKRFGGDILFRNALIQSKNIPAVKVLKDIGIDWVAEYARRLGIFSHLNMDYTLALGSSGVTLYEMTKVFSEFGRMGKRIRPVMIHKVEDKDGQVILENISLDERFEVELEALDEQFNQKRDEYYQALEEEKKKEQEAKAMAEGSGESTPASTVEQKTVPTEKPNYFKKPPFFFDDPEQLIRPTTAFLITSLLQGVIEDDHGTGRLARSLGRPVAGKTGTTNGYYDAWFVGYSTDFSTGVWVGYDNEASLGKGEVGGRSALPIWLEYMKFVHEGLPIRNFTAPEGIVFANIDSETGKLASSSSNEVVKQAFLEGTEPQVEDTTTPGQGDTEADDNFYKEDLSE
ncbi:MAG: transglycosylase domain-containing protein, partial [Bdellovibrionales bacterium]|nr:transglycosylase domain-containing protein [Bdellovibrionales bacterium]